MEELLHGLSLYVFEFFLPRAPSSACLLMVLFCLLWLRWYDEGSLHRLKWCSAGTGRGFCWWWLFASRSCMVYIFFFVDLRVVWTADSFLMRLGQFISFGATLIDALNNLEFLSESLGISMCGIAVDSEGFSAVVSILLKCVVEGLFLCLRCSSWVRDHNLWGKRERIKYYLRFIILPVSEKKWSGFPCGILNSTMTITFIVVWCHLGIAHMNFQLERYFSFSFSSSDIHKNTSCRYFHYHPVCLMMQNSLSRWMLCVLLSVL